VFARTLSNQFYTVLYFMRGTISVGSVFSFVLHLRSRRSDRWQFAHAARVSVSFVFRGRWQIGREYVVFYGSG
jgi:hypothetical protein